MSTTEARTRHAARPDRTAWVLGLVAVLLLGGIALDTKVVRIGSDQDVRQQVFDPDSYGRDQFPRIRDMVAKRAPDAAELATAIAADKDAAIAKYGTPAGVGAVMPVRLTGVVGAGKSGVFTLSVEGIPEATTVRVQTGPAINGTDLRDIPGDISFGEFTNQIEYQNAGSGINRAMAAEVLTGLDRASLEGRTVAVTGVFRLINPKNWLITPVDFEVQP
ncbi:DUF2291 domain-containing protein [Tropicimonas sp. IMCC34043]|uniref:DUF2291 domain-containing protein n=1 Tax=Tropicimonas sp. IMCC34043 TaxID=2248760 RepID=UPI000E24742A|nr:DUF2291 domain-containing protein [Tropicimonas sp. IMCC34043]